MQQHILGDPAAGQSPLCARLGPRAAAEARAVEGILVAAHEGVCQAEGTPNPKPSTLKTLNPRP